MQYGDSVFSSFEIGYRCLSDEGCVLMGCPEAWEYGAQFIVSKEYWDNIEILKLINSCIANGDMSIIYNEEQLYKDSLYLNILPSNTKTRRLGYLKALLMMLQEQPQISSKTIYKSFELYCQRLKGYLSEYKNNKGESIITKTGTSAKPYIELAVFLPYHYLLMLVLFVMEYIRKVYFHLIFLWQQVKLHPLPLQH